MDTHIVHEMDREIRSQQAKLAKVCVCMCVYVLYKVDTFQFLLATCTILQSDIKHG